MKRYCYTWTSYVFTCRHCHRLSRVAKERLERLLNGVRVELAVEPRVAQALRTMDSCISCIAGRDVDGEHDVDAVVTVV